MEYRTVEKDFIERTLEIIRQYDEYVIPKTANREKYEVTLLLNCLLGLIILPFECSKRKDNNSEFPIIFKGDDIKICSLGKEWGLANIKIDKCKIAGKCLRVDEISLRQIIAMFRHSMAHSQFGNGAVIKKPLGLSVNFAPATYNAIESIILAVNIVNKYKQRVEFIATIPIEDLRKFSVMVAKNFIEGLDN